MLLQLLLLLEIYSDGSRVGVNAALSLDKGSWQLPMKPSKLTGVIADGLDRDEPWLPALSELLDRASGSPNEGVDRV